MVVENLLRNVFVHASWLDSVYLGNSVILYMLSAILIIVLIASFRVAKYIVNNYLRHLSKKTKSDKDDLVLDMFDRLGWSFYVALAFYIGIQQLYVSQKLSQWINGLALIFITYYIVKIIFSRIDYGKHSLEKKKENTDFLDIYIKILKGLVWVVAVLAILSNMGINITSIIATLGIGGIAIALALQNVLSDIFASLSIQFDKPFKVGDFIIVGQDMGVVKKIGIKSTRIQSLWGQEIVISNQELTSTRINNYKRMEKRRIQFNFGVTYDTPIKKLKKIKNIVQTAFKTINKTKLDRVHFKGFGDSSLNYEIAYYIDSSDYNEYMDIQEEINLKIKEGLEKQKIEFAFPTRTVHLQK